MSGLFERSERNDRSGQTLRGSAARRWADVAAEDWRHLSAPRPANDLPARRFEPLSEARDDLLKQIGIALLAEMTSETAEGRVLIDALALSLTGRLAQQYSTGVVAKPAALRMPQGLDDARLQRVLDYLRDHLGEDIGVEDLAAVACLSPFHFTRIFRNSMGMPPHRYVVELRLERAKSLLARSNDSLVEIALATCFSSQSNFTRAFRQATGLTPGAFRRNSR